MRLFLSFVFVITLATPFRSSCQSGWVGGVRIRPIIPTVITQREFKTIVSDSLTAEMRPQITGSYGVLVRYNFNKSLAIEFGLDYTRRAYNLEIMRTGSSQLDKTQFGIINYEIPLQALYYVKLDDKIFANILAGTAFNFYPTDVESFGDSKTWFHRSFRREWITTSLIMNVGVEYRTEKKGNFYVGASLHRPMRFIYSIYFYNYPSFGKIAEGSIQGMYTSLDLRYFFPPSKKEKQKNKDSDHRNW